ncbi:unnamed protein product [Clonostachys rosea f. rosea IK726]|uniref:DUF3295 domain-containing protein n=2 Tax=Bionectria ochroleuca TaxID=29856 RepID=A0A0B7K0R6_BIOOC|nr:unnamed protein product [Clonostachys rosea f. rosea IK726]
MPPATAPESQKSVAGTEIPSSFLPHGAPRDAVPPTPFDLEQSMGLGESPKAKSMPNMIPQEKQASISRHPSGAIESVCEAEHIDETAIGDETAIDDEDAVGSSDWEDSDNGNDNTDNKHFQRVNSVVLASASGKSLITLMLNANDLKNHASQSTSAIPQSRKPEGPSSAVSPNGSDDGPLVMRGSRQDPLKPNREILQPTAQPIPTTDLDHGQAALSPRTNRRAMLATELSESLRRHLLWERSQSSSTANAVLKRRHTSHDIPSLRQFPEKPCVKKTEDVNASS